MSNIKEDLVNFREQVAESKSELFVMRMTHLDNRAKSYPSDKKKHRYAIRQFVSKIKSCIKNRQKELFDLKLNKNKEEVL
ncbi:hypothetical protein [Alphaproteobacteria bacterium endosymbiont of Tiliacea citrago]|uniref:hypothetical protein n=1 Tax=Alphaproteobacteria bacterium endosymbiont of Tiliacea citrago TaxID=3077944 RepID=UPI00313DA6D1